MEIRTEKNTGDAGSAGATNTLEENFTFAKLPMPPSENDQYAARAFPGKHAQKFSGERRSNFVMARICPTHTLEKFQKSVEEDWYKANIVEAHKARKLLKNWLLKGLFIEVHTYAWFKYFDLHHGNGNPKKNDASNRVKALHDSLARVLEIDDTYFKRSIVQANLIEKGTPFCSVVFRPYELLTLKQLKERGEI